MKFFRTRYRVVLDTETMLWEVSYREWYSPFWRVWNDRYGKLEDALDSVPCREVVVE